MKRAQLARWTVWTTTVLVLFVPWSRSAAEATPPTAQRCTFLYHLARHRAEVVAMDVSADGRVLATVDAKGKICEWDLQVGKLLRELDLGSQAEANHIAMAPSGIVYFIATKDGYLRRVSRDQPNVHSRKLTPPITHLDFVGENCLTVADGSRTLFRWMLVDNRRESIPLPAEASMSVMTGTANSLYFGFANSSRLFRWDLTEQKPVSTIVPFASWCTLLGTSDDGALVAAAGPYNVQTSTAAILPGQRQTLLLPSSGSVPTPCEDRH